MKDPDKKPLAKFPRAQRLAVFVAACLAGIGFLLFRSTHILVAGRPWAGTDASPTSAVHTEQAQKTNTALARPGSTPPRFKPLEAAMPTSNFEPKAAKVFAVLRGYPQTYYNAEKRVPVWATAMEGTLGNRFDSIARTLGMDIRADEIECRESTCRLEVSYGDSDVKKAIKEGFDDPLGMANERTGPLASMSYQANTTDKNRVDTKTIKRPDGRFSRTVILMFREQDGDPQTYGAYVEEQAGKMREEGEEGDDDPAEETAQPERK